MPSPRLATRYARSILDLAVEKGELEKVYADMQWLQAVSRKSREFVNVLRSPIIKSDTKVKIVEAVTGGKVGEMTSAFIRLMIHKGRESYLPEVVNAFIEQYKVKNDIHTVQLTTATEASEAMKDAIVKKIRETTKMQKIELETKVDSDIIGGFVLQIGDQLVDASIAYDLKAVARQFENNDFIYKIR